MFQRCVARDLPVIWHKAPDRTVLGADRPHGLEMIRAAATRVCHCQASTSVGGASSETCALRPRPDVTFNLAPDLATHRHADRPAHDDGDLLVDDAGKPTGAAVDGVDTDRAVEPHLAKVRGLPRQRA